MKDESFKNFMEIGTLKEKWYYRLIKVIYVFVFSFSIIIFPGIAFWDHKPEKFFDSTKSTITCIDANKKYKASAVGIFDDYRTEYDTKKIKDFCREATDFFAPNAKYNFGIFDRNDQFHTEGGWFVATGYGILALVMTFIVFELFRRIFFYVITGKFIKLK